MTLRLLVTGSRNWSRPGFIAIMLKDLRREYGQDVVLVSGACPTGADRMAEQYAEKAGWTIERHPADWDTHDKQAGYIRNAEMVKMGADLCYAFIVGNSKGSTHTANLAEKAGIKTKRFG